MKKIINKFPLGICRGLLLITLMFWNFSCTDFLKEDPKGRLSKENFFVNKEDLDLSLNALYESVAGASWRNDYVGTNHLAGDDITTKAGSDKQSLREFDDYQVANNNSWMASLWASRWQIVKAANFVINNVARTPDVSEDDIKYALAQAYYWRAYAYFSLVQTWGNVPLVLTDEVHYNDMPAPVEDVYNQIVNDLKLAEGAPVLHTKEPYVRNNINIAVSQGAAKATLAYVYLSMAGWPLNKGATYYQLAADKAREVIDGVENGTYYYSLLYDYKDVYSWKYNDKNTEVILGIYYNRDQMPTMSTLCDFLQDMVQGGWDDTHGEIKFWKDFPAGPRKDATYFPQIMLLSDKQLHDWWYDTNPPSRATVAPCFIKSAEGAVRGTEFDYTNPELPYFLGEKMHQVIRLSEVYCWYAEAIGRLGQTNAKALEALNKVRNRADGTATNIYAGTTDPNKLAEAAYNEHGWEIAGCYMGILAPRYFDMFRMNRVKDHFEYRKLNPAIEVVDGSGIYRKEGVPVTGEWDESKMYAPYPYGDASLNPNLKK